jgi:hypothetical protein
MTTLDQARSRDAVLDVFGNQCRWMVEGRADLLLQVHEPGRVAGRRQAARTGE